MDNIKIEKFTVIGISVRTSNANGEAGRDIGGLWERFFAEAIAEKIPNKISGDIYSIYTEYESDHTGAYTTLLGCMVENSDNIPDGMIAKTFETSNYNKFVANGDLTAGKVIYEKWLEIWDTDLPRTFSADFEVYGEKAQNPADAEVDIFIAVE